MGDIADMMLEGLLCEGCGIYLDDDSFGVPRYCGGCQRDNKPRKAKAASATTEPIGEKAKKLLQRVCDFTDTPAGMYPGIYWEDAPAQLKKLLARGLVDTYDPHNPVHKTRAVITDGGRAILEARKS
jgi:hypothetical protein